MENHIIQRMKSEWDWLPEFSGNPSDEAISEQNSFMDKRSFSKPFEKGSRSFVTSRSCSLDHLLLNEEGKKTRSVMGETRKHCRQRAE